MTMFNPAWRARVRNTSWMSAPTYSMLLWEGALASFAAGVSVGDVVSVAAGSDFFAGVAVSADVEPASTCVASVLLSAGVVCPQAIDPANEVSAAKISLFILLRY